MEISMIQQMAVQQARESEWRYHMTVLGWETKWSSDTKFLINALKEFAFAHSDLRCTGFKLHWKMEGQDILDHY